MSDARILLDQVAIVTGGASGIGAATVRQLRALGARVVIFDSAETFVDDAGVIAVKLDLADAGAIAPAVARVIERWQRIDILINCAAITGPTVDLLQTTLATWDSVYAVNVRAPFLLMQEVGRHMIARGAGGRIVNISSGAAFRVQPTMPAYASSKAAVVELTRAAAAQFGPHQINVNAVAPGVTATPMLGDALGSNFDELARSGPLANLLGRVSQPDDIAHVVVFLCKPESRQMTAQTIHVNAGSIAP
jgi:NAD(P)-dependent dehydrogenase (short-subunit alcohol dehydrogenase family)